MVRLIATRRSVVLWGLLSSALLLVACQRGVRSDQELERLAAKTQNISLWKQYDTPLGADSTVPAELGGPGFERIADSLGFQTYVPTSEELPFFGDPRAKTGGKIRIVVTRFPLNFRPYGQHSNYVENSIIASLVYETLLGVHPLTREFVPALASHWKILPDRKTFLYRIDPNARFSDGKPVTAHDVVATWRLVMDETILEPSLQLVFGKFEEPRALSKYLVEVRSKTLNWRNFLYLSAALPILPAHVIGNMTGKEFLERFQYEIPPGSGEYILLPEDVQKGKSYALTRRSDYWAKDYPTARYVGNFDRIEFEVVKDNPLLAYEMFKKGDCDFFIFGALTTEHWVKDTAYEALQKGWIQKRRVYTDGPVGTMGVAFNMRKPPFDDIRVRKAFAHLLNREALIRELLYDEYEPMDSYHANTVYENPNNPKVRYNPELAQQLLAEAGWKTRNAEGILVKDGKPFVVEMGIPKAIERFITPYQQELRKAGIDLQLKFQDPNTLWRNAMERNFSLFFVSWTGLQTPNPETSLRSELADKNDNNNIEGFKNPRVDQLCDMYDTAFSREAQIRIIREIDSITMASYKNVLMWYPRGIRIAYWDKFGMPEYVLPRFAQIGYIDLAIISTWWYDPEKAQRLEEARRTGEALAREPVEVRYWKEFDEQRFLAQVRPR
ncbi:MAG: extracellular solute-binding protein [Chlorobiota bacterium]